jgi:hypothetical protein
VTGDTVYSSPVDARRGTATANGASTARFSPTIPPFGRRRASSGRCLFFCFCAHLRSFWPSASRGIHRLVQDGPVCACSTDSSCFFPKACCTSRREGRTSAGESQGGREPPVCGERTRRTTRIHGGAGTESLTTSQQQTGRSEGPGASAPGPQSFQPPYFSAC